MKKFALVAMITLGAATASNAQPLLGVGETAIVGGAVVIGTVVVIATGATTSTNATP